MKNILLIIAVALGMMSFKVDRNTPTPRSEMSSTKIGDKIYIAGGINFWLSSSLFEVYDVTSNKWKKLKRLPSKLNHVGLCSDGESVYMSGGFYNGLQTKYSDILYKYNPKTNEWKKLAKMPDKRAAHYMIYREGQLHLIGGKNYKEIWTYDLHLKKWHKDKLPKLPEQRDHISVLQTDSSIYIVGGRKAGVAQADCWEYKLGEKAWSPFTEIPVARGGQTSCLENNTIHVIGGENITTNTTYKRYDIYNLKTRIWTKGKPMKTQRHGLISETHHGKWYVYGGGKKANIKTIISCTNELEIINLNQEKE